MKSNVKIGEIRAWLDDTIVNQIFVNDLFKITRIIDNVVYYKYINLILNDLKESSKHIEDVEKYSIPKYCEKCKKSQNMNNGRYRPEPTGNTIPCPGVSHREEGTGDCLLCYQNCGEIEELQPIDFEKAKSTKSDISAFDLDEEALEEAKAYIANAEAYWLYTKHEKLLKWLDYVVDVDLEELEDYE